MPADLGLLFLRAVVGVLFVGHGLQKLTRWFGGHGLAGTGQWLEGIGLRPGRPWALLAGVLETAGGVLLALGLFTPLGTVFISAVMLMAIARVHWAKGPWIVNGGYEHALTQLAAAVAVALVGPGAYALDRYVGVALPVVPVLAAGLLAALVVVALAPRPQAAARPGVQRAA
jgi:putative oxidoreductase